MVNFRCPLDKSYEANIAEKEYHDVSKVYEYYKQNYKIEIKSVFDITNSDQYYDMAEWKKYNCRPHKFKCPGKEVPPKNWTKTVLSKMNKEYEEMKKHPNTEQAIAVHCTHGLNRTGYVAISFMME